MLFRSLVPRGTNVRGTNVQRMNVRASHHKNYTILIFFSSFDSFFVCFFRFNSLHFFSFRFISFSYSLPFRLKFRFRFKRKKRISHPFFRYFASKYSLPFSHRFASSEKNWTPYLGYLRGYNGIHLIPHPSYLLLLLNFVYCIAYSFSKTLNIKPHILGISQYRVTEALCRIILCNVWKK